MAVLIWNSFPNTASILKPMHWGKQWFHSDLEWNTNLYKITCVLHLSYMAKHKYSRGAASYIWTICQTTRREKEQRSIDLRETTSAYSVSHVYKCRWPHLVFVLSLFPQFSISFLLSLLFCSKYVSLHLSALSRTWLFFWNHSFSERHLKRWTFLWASIGGCLLLEWGSFSQ